VSDLATPYSLLGGEDRVRALVDRFYDLMEELPAAAAVRAMHPSDLAGSRNKLFLFLSGWLGGPGLYVQRYGHPRLRARHLPFPIDTAGSDAWMLCMRLALEEQVESPLREQLLQAFSRTASHMENSGTRQRVGLGIGRSASSARAVAVHDPDVE